MGAQRPPCPTDPFPLLSHTPRSRSKSVDFDPIACGPVKARPEGFTRWDKIVLREGSLTPVQLEAVLKRDMGLEVQMITSGKSILYNPMLYKSHREQRANKPLVDIFNGVPNAQASHRGAGGGAEGRARALVGVRGARPVRAGLRVGGDAQHPLPCSPPLPCRHPPTRRDRGCRPCPPAASTFCWTSPATTRAAATCSSRRCRCFLREARRGPHARL